MTARKLSKKPRCICCNHPDRVLIEAARVAGMSLDSIAARYEISRDSVHRHMKDHVTVDQRADYLADVPLKDLASKAAETGLSVLEHLRIVRAALMTEFQLATSMHSQMATTSLAGKLIEVNRAIGQISGEMSNLAVGHLTINSTTNILNSPVFGNVTATLLQALTPHPEARAAVIQALQLMDQTTPMKVIEHDSIPVNAVPFGAALDVSSR
jgi:hypothetical protein